MLYAGTDDPTISLSALDDTPLQDLQVRLLGLNFSSPTFPETYVDPVSYFTNHLGTYVPDAGSEVRFYIQNFDPYVGFTVTSLTIAAVPEPATVALGLGVAALGVVLIRRRRA
ncbi:MAG: PEP-CTERM sorting domain-containing protein [Lacunisphaera sp.]|nr:PEP-CTERM sorting domain-containing protein [Lacunisphaera sp.]